MDRYFTAAVLQAPRTLRPFKCSTLVRTLSDFPANEAATTAPGRRDRRLRRRSAARRRWRLPTPSAFNFGGDNACIHSSSIGPGNTLITRTPPGAISARRHCDRERAARLGCGKSAVGRKIAEGINGQKIDPGGRIRRFAGGARSHRRSEFLSEAQQAEVVDVHFRASRLDSELSGDPIGR